MLKVNCSVSVNRKLKYGAKSALILSASLIVIQCDLTQASGQAASAEQYPLTTAQRVSTYQKHFVLDKDLKASRKAWISDFTSRANDLLNYRVGLAGKTKRVDDDAKVNEFTRDYAALSVPIMDALVGPMSRTVIGDQYPIELHVPNRVEVRSTVDWNSAESNPAGDAGAGKTVRLRCTFEVAILDSDGSYHITVNNSRSEVQRFKFADSEIWVQTAKGLEAVAWSIKDLKVLPDDHATTGISAKRPSRRDPRRDEWLDDMANLSQNPVGFTLHRAHFSDASLISIAPTGIGIARAGQFVSPTYGLGDGFEVAAGLWDIAGNNEGGSTLYPGLGIQKQLLPDSRVAPLRTALSVGAYGYSGPDTTGGSFYIAGSNRVVSRTDSLPLAVYIHSGVRYDVFSAASNQAGVRPYLGFSAALSSKYYLSGEIRYKQAWERQTPFALHATVRIYRKFGISLGLENMGYQNVISISPSF